MYFGYLMEEAVDRHIVSGNWLSHAERCVLSLVFNPLLDDVQELGCERPNLSIRLNSASREAMDIHTKVFSTDRNRVCFSMLLEDISESILDEFGGNQYSSFLNPSRADGLTPLDD